MRIKSQSIDASRILLSAGRGQLHCATRSAGVRRPLNLAGTLHRFGAGADDVDLLNRINVLAILQKAKPGGKFGIGVKVGYDLARLIGGQGRFLP
jgi:hypothetical protein